MDLQPTLSVFNDIIDTDYAPGFDEAVRQSFELSNLSAPDISTALNSVFEENESRLEQNKDGAVNCGVRIEKLDIDPLFPPPSPVSPDASLLGFQLGPTTYDHIQTNEQERHAEDFSSLNTAYAAPSTTNDPSLSQYHDGTAINILGKELQGTSSVAIEPVECARLEAPSNSTTCAIEKGPTLQSDFIACPDPSLTILSQDLQTLDNLTTQAENPLPRSPNPQPSFAPNLDPLVSGNENPDFQHLFLLRETPHVPYKKQKLDHNKRFTGTPSNHLEIPGRTKSDQHYASGNGNEKPCEAQLGPISAWNPLLLTNQWPQIMHQRPLENIMLQPAQQMSVSVPDGSRIKLIPEVSAGLQSCNDSAQLSAPLTKQPDLFLNAITPNDHFDTSLGTTMGVSDPAGLNDYAPNASLAVCGSSPGITQPQFVDTRTSQIEILHPRALEDVSPKAVRALLRSNGDDIVSKIELYWTHFQDYQITAERAGKVLKEKSVRFERRKRMGPEVPAIEKKAIRAQRNRERSQALRRYHKQRMSELEDVDRKLKTYNAVAKSLVNCLLEEPQSLKLVQEYFSTHECNEELLTFLRSTN